MGAISNYVLPLSQYLVLQLGDGQARLLECKSPLNLDPRKR